MPPTLRLGPVLLLLFALAAPQASAFEEAELQAALVAARDVEQAVRDLASDEFAGRDNLGLGSLAAQEYLIDRLASLGDGFDPLADGRDAYRQPFADGTNLLAVIPGRELPEEVVVVGAHYDHLSGFDCFGSPVANSALCNGAQDNATGVSIVLAIGRAIRALPTPPRRTVVLALWDAEEDSLLGSKFFVSEETFPLESIVGYVNFDIQGANLLPSSRRASFAIGAETGGETYRQIVGDAVAASGLGTVRLSVIFGQNRSDHASFYLRGVPSAFFTDANGGCYHTSADEPDAVDYVKLARQSQIGFRTTLALAEGDDLPETPDPPPPLVTHEDVVSIADLLTRALVDVDLFPSFLRARTREIETYFRNLADAGPEGFDEGRDTFDVLNQAAEIVDFLTAVPCDAFLDGDGDSDGVLDSDDNCPDVPNADQADADGDDIGDVCDDVQGRLIDLPGSTGRLKLGKLLKIKSPLDLEVILSGGFTLNGTAVPLTGVSAAGISRSTSQEIKLRPDPASVEQLLAELQAEARARSGIADLQLALRDGTAPKLTIETTERVKKSGRVVTTTRLGGKIKLVATYTVEKPKGIVARRREGSYRLRGLAEEGR